MLTLARQEPGAADYRLSQVNLAELVRQCVVEHAVLADARRVDLGVTQVNDEAVVSGDVEALRILLSNLVGNALRYTPGGGRVDVSCGVADGRGFVEVADTGPGIPVAERERVFDRFYRQGGEGETGSGLGLAIVRTIADRHGARVSLAESDSGGLRVRVEFSR